MKLLFWMKVVLMNLYFTTVTWHMFKNVRSVLHSPREDGEMNCKGTST